MTEFTKNELLRLVDKIPETDPTTTAYHVLLQSVECFNSLALTVDEILALRDGVSPSQEQVTGVNNVVPFTAPDFPAETPEEQEGHEVAELVKKAVEAQPAPPTLSASDVRKALVEVKAKGVDVKEVLSEFGVTDFRALPAAKYGQLMARLEAM